MGTGRSGLTKHGGSLPPGVKDISHKVDSSKYKVFRDRPSGTHEYVGSGADVANFFEAQSNFREIIQSMSTEERQHFFDWSQGQFMGNNKSDWNSLLPYEQNMLRAFDKILDKSTVIKTLS